MLILESYSELFNNIILGILQCNLTHLNWESTTKGISTTSQYFIISIQMLNNKISLILCGSENTSVSGIIVHTSHPLLERSTQRLIGIINNCNSPRIKNPFAGKFNFSSSVLYNRRVYIRCWNCCASN